MKLNYNVTEIEKAGQSRRKNDSTLIIEKFIKSGKPIAEVQFSEIKPISAYQNLLHARKQSGLQVGIMRRGKKIYLTKIAK